MAMNVEDLGAHSLLAVTPSDTVALPGPCRALWIGTTGNVAVICSRDSTAVTLNSVPVGILPVRAKYVMSTNTTASNIVAIY